MPANPVDTTATLEYAAEDSIDDSHKHYDAGYKPAFAEIASLFEDINADLAVITDRLDDRKKGLYTRNADTVANNPANIAQAARNLVSLDQSGKLGLINAEIGNPADLSDTSSTNYGVIKNNKVDRTGIKTAGSNNKQFPGYGATDAFEGSDGELYYENTIPFEQLRLGPGTSDGKVKYSLLDPRRSPIQAELFNILETAAAAAKVNVSIISGGQIPVSEGGIEGKTRKGSNRYDKGYAAEVRLTDNDAVLSTTNPEELPIMLEFVQACKDAGATAVGMGNGYLENTNIHIDIAWKGFQAGIITKILPLRYWGGDNPTNTINAPKYLSDLMAPKDNIAEEEAGTPF